VRFGFEIDAVMNDCSVKCRTAVRGLASFIYYEHRTKVTREPKI